MNDYSQPPSLFPLNLHWTVICNVTNRLAVQRTTFSFHRKENSMFRKLSLLLTHLVVLTLLLQPVASATSPGLIGSHPDFNATAAKEEGYWYSRYSMNYLTQLSGLGVRFTIDPALIAQMKPMADADPNDGDFVRWDEGSATVQAVYASGDPHYAQTFNEAVITSRLWDPATFDTTITSRAMGWTIVKEVEWAKQFHVDSHFGTPTDNFGAHWRFIGMILMVEAKAQFQYITQHLMNGQGLISNSDGTIDWSGQWVMLEALSDLGQALDAPHMPLSVTNRYSDPGAAATIRAAADNLFHQLLSRRPADAEELSLALQALTWYGSTANFIGDRAAAVGMIHRHGNELMRADTSTPTLKAFAIRGLIEAYRTTTNDRYLDGAANLFNALVAEYDVAHGRFTSQNSYTIDNIGTILGAVNSLKLFAGATVDQVMVETIFSGFFESSVNISGLIQSAPPKFVARDPFEQNDPNIYYGYPGLPVPPLAGPPFGIAPVLGTEVTWDGNQWQLTNGRFDSAGAMHAANEFIWFHNDEVNGFPVISN